MMEMMDYKGCQLGEAAHGKYTILACEQACEQQMKNAKKSNCKQTVVLALTLQPQGHHY